MINHEQYRAIEGRLYHYRDMKVSLDSYQQAQMSLRCAPLTGLPRGQALRCDPTAQGALALAEPPPSIDQSRRWVDAIDHALSRLTCQSPQLMEVARAYYLEGGETPVRQRISEICETLNLQRALFNQYRRCIVHAVFLQALYERLLTPDEAGLRELMTS